MSNDIHIHQWHYSLITALAIMGLLAACGPAAPTTTPPLTPTATAPPSPALATASPGPRGHQATFCFFVGAGPLDAPSHNSVVWTAVQHSAQAIGAQATNFVIPAPVDFGKDIESLIASGTDIFVVESSIMQPVVLAAARKYPAVYFIGLDQSLDDQNAPPNYVGLLFADDRGGFLAGALAAQITKTRKVGAIMAFSTYPAEWRLAEGFRAGVRYIDPAVAVEVDYHDDTEMTNAFNDPAWGEAHGARQLATGVDVLFADSSGTGTGALGAVAKYQRQTGQRVFAISEDFDVYPMLPDAHPVLVSSAVREYEAELTQLFQNIMAGTFRGGNHQGAMGLTPFHDLAGQVPAAVQAQLQQLTQSLNDGSLKTQIPASKELAP